MPKITLWFISIRSSIRFRSQIDDLHF